MMDLSGASSPDWAVQRITRSQRRHPQLWALSREVQHRASVLAHQIDDPPAGLDQPFDPVTVAELVEAIRRLCDEIAGYVTGDKEEEGHDRTD